MSSAVVLAAADQDPYGFVVVPAPEHVVDERDVEIELPGIFGLELSIRLN
ncbi:hypothetical protein ABIB51_003005 [Arthrobacter sp. UYCu712]